MKNIGRMATGLMALVMAGAVAIGVRSIPDVKRYLKIRSM